MNEDRRCTAHSSRTGKRCRKHAMIGVSVCGSHGGRAPQVRSAAKERLRQQLAREQVAMLGLRREVDPQTALLEEVWRAAGHVAWLGQRVQRLTEADVESDTTWVPLYQDERDRLARVAKAAIDAGIAERSVGLAEDQAQRLAQVISAVLTDLGHDLDDPKVRQVVGLQLVEGGAREYNSIPACQDRTPNRKN